MEFKPKPIRRDKERHFTLINGTANENYALNSATPKLALKNALLSNRQVT